MLLPVPNQRIPSETHFELKLNKKVSRGFPAEFENRNDAPFDRHFVPLYVLALFINHRTRPLMHGFTFLRLSLEITVQSHSSFILSPEERGSPRTRKLAPKSSESQYFCFSTANRYVSNPSNYRFDNGWRSFAIYLTEICNISDVFRTPCGSPPLNKIRPKVTGISLFLF